MCCNLPPGFVSWTWVARHLWPRVGQLIGYARVSTRLQDTDRQVRDLLAVGVRRDDLYVGYGVSGARTTRPAFDRALAALHEGDTLTVTTVDRLGRSTVNMLGLSEELRGQGINLRFNDAQPIAAIERLTRGNFRFLERLFPQTSRVLKSDQLEAIPADVVETVASILVIWN